MTLILDPLPETYSIVRLRASQPLPPWALRSLDSELLFSITRLSDELSIVCPARCIPSGEFTRSDGWRALRFDGPLDLTATGILASVVRPLAEAGVSVFALATYDTDLILIRDEQLPQAVRALNEAGHAVR
jgi:hypothetical protein